MRSQNNVVLLSCLLVASCATVVPGRALPPVDLMQDCPAPSSRVDTNGALAAYIDSLKEALRGCNRDKEALRDWARESNK